MIRSIILIAVLLAVPPPARAESHTVNSIPALQYALNKARPGDRITVKNGTYTATEAIAISCKGTASRPIIIKAEASGGVVFKGSNGFILSPGSGYIIIKGFVFRQNTGTFSIAAGTTHCMITRNVFECAPVNTGTRPYLSVSGDDNEISYNTFQNKSDEGQMVSVQGPGGDKMAKRTWIHHNYFFNFPPNANNCSAIQIGLSGRSMDSSFCVVEYNLFVKTAGENEGAICAKACNNIIRFNTFGEGSEELSLRHGNKSQVYGNFFEKSTGLRFSGDDHLIYNNYFSVCSRAIVCTNGDGEVKDGSKLTCHDRPDRVVIINNTIIGCKSSFQMPERNNGIGATGITFSKNIINGGTPVSIKGLYKDAIWTDNMILNTTHGDIPESGYKSGEAVTVADMKLRFKSPDGKKYLPIPATNKPLTVADVGPEAR